MASPKAPCGHDGEYIIGNFVRCLTKGCDGVAKPKSVPFVAKTSSGNLTMIPDDFWDDEPTNPFYPMAPAWCP